MTFALYDRAMLDARSLCGISYLRLKLKDGIFEDKKNRHIRYLVK